MVPLLRGSSTSWRAEVLIQGAGTGEPLRSPAYTGVRSRDISNKLRAMASLWPRSSAPTPG